MKFSVECEMPERWIPHFTAMLEYMEHLGEVGSSRLLTFYADGDGDFHPKFVLGFDREVLEELVKAWPDEVAVKETRDMEPRFGEGDRFFDAG